MGAAWDRSRASLHAPVGAPIDLGGPVVADALARCTFPPPGTPVACGVSGGADSLALLVLAVAAGCVPHAFHVDHGLRAGSSAEAQLVVEVAGRLGVGCTTTSVGVEDGPNLEARARQARIEQLPPDVLTGHTADDRAETVLLNLVRGAGPAGARGIARSPKRPLLDLRRADTEAVCAEVGLEPFHDPSNQDPRFRRNRVRHEVLPLLAEVAERDVVAVLVRQADLFADLAAYVDEQAAALSAPPATGPLRTADPVVARAAIRRWLLAEGVGDGHPPDAAVVERVLAVVRHEAVATEVAGAWRISRRGGRLSVGRSDRWQDAPHG